MQFVIVTPSYNLDKFIDQTIASVVFQHGDFTIRYHVQDGGSTDGTLKILEKWKRLISSSDFPKLCRGVSFSYSVEKDNGMYDAINRGFTFARKPEPESGSETNGQPKPRKSPHPLYSKLLSSYEVVRQDEPEAEQNVVMTWLNADDIFYPGALTAVTSFFREHPSANLVGGIINIMSSDGFVFKLWPIRGYSRIKMALGIYDGRKDAFVMQEGTFWTAGLWNKIGGLDPALRYAGDFDLWFRFAQHAEYHQLETLLASHRRRVGQLSSNLTSYFAEVDSIQNKDGGDMVLPRHTKTSSRISDGTFTYDLDSGSWKFSAMDQPVWLPKAGFSGEEGPFASEGIVSGRWIIAPEVEAVLQCNEAGLYDINIDYRNPLGANEVVLSGEPMSMEREAMSVRKRMTVRRELVDGWNLLNMTFAKTNTVEGDPRPLVIFLEDISMEPVAIG